MLISILQITNDPVANKLISLNSIDEIDDGKIIEENKNKKSGMGFYILRGKLAFAKLSQTFSTTPILSHLDPKCPIQIDTNVLGHTIDQIINQLTSNNLS